MKIWQLRLEDALSAVDASPVLTRDLIARYASSAREKHAIAESTLTWWIQRAVRNGRLAPVQRGLYLNRFRAKPVQLADAVAWLHKDAVVSLTTVLGDAGVFNNPSNTITAVVPLDPGAPPPRLGRKRTAAGTFHFYGIPRRILEAGKADDRLESADQYEHPRATAEKALIDWLYLGQSPRSKRTLPPRGDIDLALLRLPRLRRLAAVAGLGIALENWLR